MDIWTIWLIVAGISLILEMLSPAFLFFWCGMGAIIAMISSFVIPEMVTLQIGIFVVSSIILILFAKKILKKTEPASQPMNVYSIIGKRAIVTEEINDNKSQGQVKVGGDIWSARNENIDEIIPKDAIVEITNIEGVKVIVKKIMTSSEKTISQNEEVKN